MKILIAGGHGFIGRHCAAALTAAGHEVVCGGRKPQTSTRIAYSGHMQMDFLRDFDADVWRPRLAGFDFVINAVGIMAERGGQSLDAVHTTAPRAMFAACAALNLP